MSVPDWHERLLKQALAWRERHSDFTFNLRTADITGSDRLSAGYWFTGNDSYLFFAPFKPHDQNNKTRTIGFVVNFDGEANPVRCSLSIVFGSTTDESLRKLYVQMMDALGPFTKIATDKYERRYDSREPEVCFRQFLEMDLPRLRDLISAAGKDDTFLVDQQGFSEMLSRIDRVRNANGSQETSEVDEVRDAIAAAPSANKKSLCLLGTWRDVAHADAQGVSEAILSRGGWASWWSFPINDRFRAELSSPFYLYLNSGGGRFPYRMRIEQFKSVAGNEGIETPWPKITNQDLLGKRREGDKPSEVFKTWLHVSKIEPLQPPLTLDDFSPAEGVKRSALLNQSAFGYAYRNEGNSDHAPAEKSNPTNLILYGPPGTGKTHWIRQKFSEYTDTPNQADESSWLNETLANYGWRSVIVAALADIGRAARVPEIRAQQWVQAKTQQRGRTSASVQATIWGYLQEHSPESSSLSD